MHGSKHSIVKIHPFIVDTAVLVLMLELDRSRRKKYIRYYSFFLISHTSNTLYSVAAEIHKEATIQKSVVADFDQLQINITNT